MSAQPAPAFFCARISPSSSSVHLELDLPAAWICSSYGVLLLHQASVSVPHLVAGASRLALYISHMSFSFELTNGNLIYCDNVLACESSKRYAWNTIMYTLLTVQYRRTLKLCVQVLHTTWSHIVSDAVIDTDIFFPLHTHASNKHAWHEGFSNVLASERTRRVWSEPFLNSSPL